MTNSSEDAQRLQLNSMRRRTRIINLVDSSSQQFSDSWNYSDEYIADTLRKINAILDDLAKVQKKIEFFSGVSEETTEYLDIENILFDELIELDKIKTSGNDKLNQEKKKTILVVQEQLKTLEKKLQDNLVKLNGNKEEFAQTSISEMQIPKEDKMQNTEDGSLPDTHLEALEERKDYYTADSLSNRKLSQERLNTNSTNSLERSDRIEQYLQKRGQDHDTYNETFNSIVENSKIQEQNENLNKEFYKQILNNCNAPLRLRTSSAREILNTGRITEGYRGNSSSMGQKTIQECLVSEVMSVDIFNELFKIVKGYGKNLLRMLLPTVEMGNRLALKRIQMVLLQIRLLLIILILEIPFVTALMFCGLYLFMPNIPHNS